LELKDFKYSYNKLHKVYRVKLFEHGKWRKCTYDKKNFEFLIANNLKTKNEIRSFSYRPYFFHSIKWLSIKLWKWIKKNDPKIKYILNSGTFIIIGAVSMFFINHWLDNKEKDTITKYEQELKLKEQTIQNYEVFSDSLLREIKKKELIIKDFELAHHKYSILMNGND
jgi:hypothetical protein